MAFQLRRPSRPAPGGLVSVFRAVVFLHIFRVGGDLIARARKSPGYFMPACQPGGMPWVFSRRLGSVSTACGLHTRRAGRGHRLRRQPPGKGRRRPTDLDSPLIEAPSLP